MKNLFRSTTSLTLSLALAFPHGAFAQDQDVPECGPVGEASEFPCAFDDQTIENADELRIAADLSAKAEAEAGEGEASAEAEAETEAESGSLLEEAGDAADAATTAVTDATEQAAEVAEDAAAAAEAQTEAAAEEAEEVAEQAEAAVEAEAEATAEAEVTAEAESNAEAEVTPEVSDETAQIRKERGLPPLEEEASPEEAANAQASAEADSETAEIEAERGVQTDADAAATTDTDVKTDSTAAATEDGEANPEAEAAAEAGMTEEQRQAQEERRAERREERRAERRAEREAAAAAAAAAAENEAEAEVVTEEVTEEDVRSSDEDFETEVTASGETAAAVEDNDSGMSDFEKALLLGLGAVAVGSVLNNGEKIVSRSGDRVVVQDPDGELRVLKDDNALIRRPGDQVQTQTFDDGSTRTIVTKNDGTRIETIRSRDGSVLRRTHFDAQGREYVLVDDLVEEREVVVSELPQVQETPEPRRASAQDEEALRRALQAELRNDQGRSFSLRQVREIREVRSLAPELELDAVRFPTGSAAIQPEQARALANIGTTLRDLIQKDPRTVILVEGHTDAVGDASYNLALSDRRAETVALALTEYFNVPPENLITQGYGESQLRVPTNSAEPANRRAVVRNITGLLR
ncbi:OmpA family protein [Sulfitobacter delicatus]|uniref:OmpA family protein n=1 Tax=Sulfitobacter delicatus TaxID=218672 RepID=A0A1G7PSS9_9RHOB|nr:OmpA family protein [Sulfitobacter delicatus]SDF89253.1 OmpA family protein [Sulfitobacter delicatus]